VEFQQGQSYVGAPYADTEWGRRTALLTLGVSGMLAIGEIVCRDVTQLSGEQSWVGNTQATTPSGYTPQPDMVVPAKSSNAGLVYGIFKGYQSNQPGYTVGSPCYVDQGSGPASTGIYNGTTTTQTYLINVQWLGYTQLMWAKALSSGTITVGGNLIANPGSAGSTVASAGAFTGNKNLGIASAGLAQGALTGTLVSAVAAALLSTALSTSQYGQLNVDLNLV